MSDDEGEYFYYVGLQRHLASVFRALAEEGRMSEGDHEVFMILVRMREQMGAILGRPVAHFREDSCLIDLSDQLRVVLEMLQSTGECHLKWLTLLKHADMIDMLLRLSAVLKREADEVASYKHYQSSTDNMSTWN